jgi:alpha-glucosidase
MDIRKITYVLRAIGINGIVRTLQYGFARVSIDKKYSKRISAIKRLSPGELQSDNSINRGIQLKFEHSSVDIIFLSPNLIQISWEPGKLPFPYSIAKFDWETQHPLTISDTSGHSLIWGDFNVTIDNMGGICFQDFKGNILRRDNPPIREGDQWSLSTILTPEEHIYGLGERASSLNLRPGNYYSWNTDPAGSYTHGNDPLYIGTPIYLSLSNAGSYLVFFENSFKSYFQIDDSFNASFAGGMLRYYLIFGSFEKIFEQLSELVGRPCIPPRWVLGYHQSRWGYRTETDIREVVKGFEEHDLPLNAIHLDIDYMDGFRVFTINTNRFPEMKKLTSDLEDKGIKLVASLNPAVKRDRKYEVYKEGLSKDVFCKLPNGKILSGVSWPGWSVFPDFTKPEARKWWKDQYQSLLRAGISGIWHDMNEPASFAAWGDKTFPITTSHFMDGRGGDHLEAHNLYGLLMNQAGYEAIQEFAPNKRPWIFSRAGWAGLQRYAWNWTGDVETSWEALQQTIPTILGLSLSGHAFSGVDIGGFSGSPSAELYLRWFQLATFLLLFRTHSAIGTKPREPWSYGEPTTSIIRNFLKLRYKLLPYIYTLAWEAAHTGISPIRPIFWEHPEDQALWDVEDEFLLGNAVLLAPILHEKEQKRRITIPLGNWYSFWDDQLYVGPSQFELPVTLATIPLFIQGGTLLPMEEDGKICFHVYPDIGTTNSNQIYFDDGDGYGSWRVDNFQSNTKQNSMDISWVHEGEFPFPYPYVTIRIHGKQLNNAIVDGNTRPIDDNTLVTPIFKNLKLNFY